MSPLQPENRHGRRLDRWAGGLFLVAATIHGGLAPEHFSEWWGYGLFFLLSGVLQAVWGLAFLTDAVNPRDAGPKWRPMRTAMLVLGIAGTLVTWILYVASRTIGVPVGPAAGEVEGVAPIDVVSKAVEGALLVVLLVLLQRHLRAPAGRPDDGAERT